MAKRPAFSFGNLKLGGKSRAEDVEEDEDITAEDENVEDDDESTAEDQEDQEEASDDEKDDEAEGGDDEEQATAFARGRAAERARIGKILSSSAVGPGNFQTAAALAVNGDMKPSAAIAVLKTTDKKASGGLSAAMAGRDPAPPGAGGDGGGKGGGLAAKMSKRFGKGGR